MTCLGSGLMVCACAAVSGGLARSNCCCEKRPDERLYRSILASRGRLRTELRESLRLELGRCLETVVSHGFGEVGLEISHVCSPHPEPLSAFFCWEAWAIFVRVSTVWNY